MALFCRTEVRILWVKDVVLVFAMTGRPCDMTVLYLPQLHFLNVMRSVYTSSHTL